MEDPFKLDEFDFFENQTEITKKINNRLKAEGLKDPKGFTIVPGFVVHNLKTKIIEYMHIDGPAYPVIVVVANSTGRTYEFSLKHLFPNVEVI